MINSDWQKILSENQVKSQHPKAALGDAVNLVYILPKGEAEIFTNFKTKSTKQNFEPFAMQK